jgi:hypothetical protein
MAEAPTSSPDQAATRDCDALLATKLSIPRTHQDRLARSRLLEALDRGPTVRLTSRYSVVRSRLCPPISIASWATL